MHKFEFFPFTLLKEGFKELHGQASSERERSFCWVRFPKQWPVVFSSTTLAAETVHSPQSSSVILLTNYCYSVFLPINIIQSGAFTVIGECFYLTIHLKCSPFQRTNSHIDRIAFGFPQCRKTSSSHF